MDRRSVIGVVLIGSIGILLLDKGITGLVIIEDSGLSLENAASHFNFLLGCVLVLTAIYSVAWMSAGRKPQM